MAGKVAVLLPCLLLSQGCDIKVEQPAAQSAENSHIVQVPPTQAAVVGKGVESQDNSDRHNSNRDSADRDSTEAKSKNRNRSNIEPIDNRLAQADISPGKDRRDGGNTSGPSKSGVDLRQAFSQVAAEIRDSLGLRKTLVVWLVEQTAASGGMAGDAADQIAHIMQDLDNSESHGLEMAVVGYGSDANLLTPEPLSDVGSLRKAVVGLKEKKDETAAAFAALKLAVDKFLPYRSRGYEVMFVFVGVSSGDDLDLADDSVAALIRQASSVYGIGPKVPFGPPSAGGNNNGRNPKRPTPPPVADTGKRQFDSFAPERIQLALSGGQNASDLNDSGCGPFGLERICRQTDGKLFRLHEARPAGWDLDPETGDVKAELQIKYAPDYVNQHQYQQLLTENKCRMALHNTALLPPTVGMESPKVSFDKPKDEAALAKEITNAQKAAAESDQPIQKIYDTLIVGEADRPKLTGARWQAAYDLAMGQTLAAKARLDGYNAMLAILKQGKAFTNAESKRWVLQPADEIAAGSTLDKMAKNSRMFLQRVVKEHPGTPWAAIAQRELRYPAGWKLVEQ